MEGTAVL